MKKDLCPDISFRCNCVNTIRKSTNGRLLGKERYFPQGNREGGGGKKEKCGGIRDGWNRERRNVGGGLSRNGKDRSTDRNVQ